MRSCVFCTNTKDKEKRWKVQKAMLEKIEWKEMRGGIMTIPFYPKVLSSFSSNHECFQRRFSLIWRTYCFPA